MNTNGASFFHNSADSDAVTRAAPYRDQSCFPAAAAACARAGPNETRGGPHGHVPRGAAGEPRMPNLGRQPGQPLGGLRGGGGRAFFGVFLRRRPQMLTLPSGSVGPPPLTLPGV